jgi:gamma-glutamylaminecyclotransferase
MTMTPVFVYGTLKRGLSNSGWLRGQVYAGEARTEARYRLYDLGGYPGMVEEGTGDGVSIEGEVWDVDEAGLLGLDVLEGVAEGEYALVPVALQGEWAERRVRGYVYLGAVEGCKDCGVSWNEGSEG